MDFDCRFRESYPHAKSTFVSIKASPARSHFLKRIEASNDLVRQFLLRELNAFYLNVYDCMMLNENRDIREEPFAEDVLHMNRKGYALWKDMFSANEKEIFYDLRLQKPEKRAEILPETGNLTQIPTDLGPKQSVTANRDPFPKKGSGATSFFSSNAPSLEKAERNYPKAAVNHRDGKKACRDLLARKHIFQKRRNRL